VTAKKCIEILKRLANMYGFTYTISEYSNPFKTTDENFVRKISHAYKNTFDNAMETSIMPSWTDANNFASMGIPAAVFGPGSLLYAHSEYEKISITEIVEASRFLVELAKTFEHHS